MSRKRKLLDKQEAGKRRLRQFGRHSLADRKNDLYETPPCATRALIPFLDPTEAIWEPACGPGAIVRELRDAGFVVHATDLVDYGLEDSFGGIDFLMERPDRRRHWEVIVTNPPFKLADQFTRHALTLARTVWIFQRLNWLEGVKRADLMDRHLDHILLGRERLPMMHRDGWEGPKLAASAMPFAWFCFEAERPATWPARFERISWRGA
jgi:hypothetical protein